MSSPSFLDVYWRKHHGVVLILPFFFVWPTDILSSSVFGQRPYHKVSEQGQGADDQLLPLGKWLTMSVWQSTIFSEKEENDAF